MAETSLNRAASVTRPMRSALAVIAAVAWFALALQLLLMVQQAAPGTSLHAIINYFSFFTILTNLLVALGTSLPLIAGKHGSRAIFSSAFGSVGNRRLHRHRRHHLQFAAAPYVEPAGHAKNRRRLVA